MINVRIDYLKGTLIKKTENMKKIIFKALVFGAVLAFNTNTASAQSGLFGSNSGATVSSIIQGLTTIFSGDKVATADKIVGTWVYEEPAVVFQSSNMLKQAGGSLVSSTIEKRLQSILGKYGIKKGKFKMTFDKKGNFTQTIGKRTVHGTYTIEDKHVNLTYDGGFKQLAGTTQLDGNSLLIVMDTAKLLKFAGVVGSYSTNSLVKSAAAFLSGMEGMECGVRLKKK